MPRVNIMINQYKISAKFPNLIIDINKLNNLLIEIMIKELSCKEVQLKENFFIIAPQEITLPNTLMSLIDIEIKVVSYEERLKRQKEICKNIENYLQDNINKVFSSGHKTIEIKERVFKSDLSFMSDMAFNEGPIGDELIVLQ